MCFGPELLLMAAGGALGAGGSLLSNAGANRQAGNIAKARNEELFNTLRKNDALAAQSRAVFDERRKGVEPESFQQASQEAVNARTAPLEAAVVDMPVSTPITGSAPEIVRSDLARVMAETVARGKAQAKGLGKLGSYGDTWFNQGLANTGAGRDIGVTNDFAAGNLSILPYLMDYAEIGATKPNWMSTLGGVMGSAGGILGSLAGAKGGGKVFG